MKLLFIILAIITLCVTCHAQTKDYKEYEVCSATELHKGKVNHGKPYCVAWIGIREYKSGRKDTISWMSGGKIFFGDEYKEYEKLSERGKYIIDSLKEDGITALQQNYLMYEPIGMKDGKKTEWLWSIEDTTVMLYQYSFWHSSKGSGFNLLNSFAVK